MWSRVQAEGVAVSDLASEPVDATRLLELGTEVEVRDSFEGHWHAGYVVAAVEDGGARYRLRRASDGSVLPEALPRTSIRRRRRSSMWWI